MPKFRKKPVVIEARQLGHGYDEDLAIMRWCGGTARIDDVDALFWIRTLEGEMAACPDDWIVCGVKGEFYPVKPDIFAATYEPEPPA